MNPRKQTQDIRTFIVLNVRKHPKDIAKFTAKEFNISRQAVNRYIRTLVDKRFLEAHGNTKARQYELIPLVRKSITFDLVDNLEEHKIWREIVQFVDEQNVPKNTMEICEYGVNEMVNNVVDHSEGTSLEIILIFDIDRITFWITDDGIGIFDKIQNELNLDDKLHAVFELSKGKLTTDPENHTGEGIFFTSRAFDEFCIISDGLFFSHNPLDRDWVIETREGPETGTIINMHIQRFSKRILMKVFEEFTTSDDFKFSKTIVPVSLARYGEENLISRSQAKRILLRFEKFSEIMLDFNGVEVIGQAFADEIFRVFARKHPEITLIPIRANKGVQNMINRAITRE
ncbi:MAG: STAS-like domain-containing protein [Candidatus Kariarchaeaceae archaeon]